jgi:hypothetical protein
MFSRIFHLSFLKIDSQGASQYLKQGCRFLTAKSGIDRKMKLMAIGE